jgi:hypothetical protein
MKERIFQPGDVLSYMEMCSPIGVNLQRGTGKPAESKRLAMPPPMIPSPRIATRGFDIESFTPTESH